ncbi:dimethyl sulfoxide reductase anchor subunit [Halorhodospira halochloris]|uniref:Anaerobic dimethyl sulfoxide reductase chain C n=1 Tax=Halorhodospira halochloris TaxID=1052 RepID=A0A0X8XA81_HALHR|nr:DmsC/YnfH family molybdoenzyme membrane anchor subunit [Halorhodospira halochloris]MBK1652227.1 hypothetical protein [Halorhodospira halochloris]MCG5531030.1 dimethyl sulfoxide reductase anchor subunit [Halorhodospira halochloris]BAU58350.1 anaerobic dimethyl sulfoxide reductase chain C [Halorhodospira halochloris]
MHAPLSVVLFTVLSGAGFGFVALFIFADLFAVGGAVERGELLGASVLGLVVVTAGLLFSTGHLTKPRQGWRALARVRSSWLSREAAVAGLFYPVALLYVLFYAFSGAEHSAFTVILALLTAALALGTMLTTGMIYACVRAVRDWNQSLTPVNFLLLGLGSGAALLVLVRFAAGADPQPLAAVGATVLAVAVAAKSAWYWGKLSAGNSTPGTALGLTNGKVRLHYEGHAAPTFLDHELMANNHLKGGLAWLYRAAVVAGGLLLPAILLGVVAAGGSWLWAFLALALALGGAVLERWLFFAEARHAVRLYYAEQRI